MSIKKQRILIIEDQKLHLAKALKFCKDNGYEVVGHTDNAEEALRLTLALKPDVALVDIKLKGVRSGIDFARAIRKETDLGIIFITSLMDDEVLKEAAEVNPEAYLVKPFDAFSLKAAVDISNYQAEPLKKQETLVEMAGPEMARPGHFFVRIGKMFKKIELDHILLLKTTREKYIDIELESGRTFAVRKSLSQMEEILPDHFWRIHRNHLVNSVRIASIDTSLNYIIINGKQVTIGRSYRKVLSEKFRFIS